MKKKSVFIISVIVPVMVAPVLLANSANAATIGGTPTDLPSGGSTGFNNLEYKTQKTVSKLASVFAHSYADSLRLKNSREKSLEIATQATFKWQMRWVRDAGNVGVAYVAPKASVDFQFSVVTPAVVSPKPLKEVPYCININLSQLKQPKPNFAKAIGQPLKNQVSTTDGSCHTPYPHSLS